MSPINRKHFLPIIFSEDGANLILSIYTDVNKFAFCIHSRETQRILAWGDFPLNELEIDSEIENIFQGEQLLNFDFHMVVIALYSEKFTMVPAQFFSKKNGLKYLEYNQNISNKETILFDIFNCTDLINIYAIPEKVKNWFIKRLKKQPIFLNYSTALIENVFKSYDMDIENGVVVNLKKSNFELIVFKYNKLQFFNHFNFNTTQEYMYYLLYTFERLKINPKKTKINYIGLDAFSKDDSLVAITNKYISTIVENVPFNKNRIDPILDKKALNSSYFTLLNQYKCAL